MPVYRAKPNADVNVNWATEPAGAPNHWDLINHGVGTPTLNEYVQATSDIIDRYKIGPMPADFGNVTAVTCELHLETATGGNFANVLMALSTPADAEALTNTLGLAANSYTPATRSLALTPDPLYTGKTFWDHAEYQMVRFNSSDPAAFRLYELEVVITYDAAPPPGGASNGIVHVMQTRR